ncbi:putative mitochondrial protein [Andalucia godoyi]|uniref:Putative mitochondrial protein n=1 Tax=Andalucia godoyi TaxID=505711 RepID=A0A8K0AI92_ANDGO|nr:putative mitochondrial protein [Andalucia godoyi]|eukprot:ANDGO_08804.mRNA.1 putative mitochondrial protein
MADRGSMKSRVSRFSQGQLCGFLFGRTSLASDAGIRLNVATRKVLFYLKKQQRARKNIQCLGSFCYVDRQHKKYSKVSTLIDGQTTATMRVQI